MDSIKDNNPEAGRTSKNLDLYNKNQDFFAHFKDDSHFVFMYKKTEKLVTAVYMITNFFSDMEPMKWSLRKKSGELLSLMCNYKDVFSSARSALVQDVKTRILEILSLLEVSAKGGMISDMNVGILKQEFVALLVTLETSSEHEKSSEKGVLPPGFFDLVEDAHAPAKTTLPRPQYSTPASAPKHRESAPDTHATKRSHRQEIILALLRKKGELRIKDISDVIKDCSEKTIQRELIAFMSAGLLKRTGERRWSRYSLK